MTQAMSASLPETVPEAAPASAPEFEAAPPTVELPTRGPGTGPSVAPRTDTATATAGHLAVMVAVVLPFHLYWSLEAGKGPVDGPFLSLQDGLLFALLGVGLLARLDRRRTDRRPDGRPARRPARLPVDVPGRLLLLFLAAVAVSFAAAPSGRGVLVLARLGGVLVLVDLLRHDARLRARVAAGLVVATSIEAVVMLGQRITGRAIGLGPFESPRPFLELMPGYPTPLGTTGHPYHAGFLCAVGAVFAVSRALAEPAGRARRWGAAAVLLAFAAGQSSSRMLVLVVLAIATGTAVVAFGDRARRARGLLLAALIAAPTLAWTASLSNAYRRPEIPGASAVESLATARGSLIGRSIDLWQGSPVLGVGPGNSYATEREQGLPELSAWPIVVHNFGLQVLSETGVVGASALAACVGGIALWIRRRGRWRSVVLPLALLGPVALLDHILWTFGFGLIAIGLLLAPALADEDTPRPAPR
jgi:O-antigen ligase